MKSLSYLPKSNSGPGRSVGRPERLGSWWYPKRGEDGLLFRPCSVDLSAVLGNRKVTRVSELDDAVAEIT